MEIIISGRHLSVTDDIKAFAEGRLAKVLSMFPKLTSARVVLDHQKAMAMAEVTLHGKHVDMVANGKAEDIYVAIDEAVSNLGKQLHKHVEKIHDHRNHAEKEKMLEESAKAV